MKSKTKPSFLEDVNRMYDRAAATLNLRPGLAEQIKKVKSVYQVRFPVLIRGEYRSFTGWRAVHSEHRLPVKGGIRYAPVVALHDRACEKGLYQPESQCPRPGHRYWIPGDGVDCRRLPVHLPERDQCNCLRDREAAYPGGHPRPGGGDRTRSSVRPS